MCFWGVFMKYHRLCKHFANPLSGIMYWRRGMTQAMPLRQYKSNVLSLKPMSENRTETSLDLQILAPTCHESLLCGLNWWPAIEQEAASSWWGWWLHLCNKPSHCTRCMQACDRHVCNLQFVIRVSVMSHTVSRNRKREYICPLHISNESLAKAIKTYPFPQNGTEGVHLFIS